MTYQKMIENKVFKDSTGSYYVTDSEANKNYVLICDSNDFLSHCENIESKYTLKFTIRQRNIKFLNTSIEELGYLSPVTSDRGTFSVLENREAGVRVVKVWSYETLIFMRVTYFRKGDPSDVITNGNYIRKPYLWCSHTTSKLMSYLISGFCYTLNIYDVRNIALEKNCTIVSSI